MNHFSLILSRFSLVSQHCDHNVFWCGAFLLYPTQNSFFWDIYFSDFSQYMGNFQPEFYCSYNQQLYILIVYLPFSLFSSWNSHNAHCGQVGCVPDFCSFPWPQNMSSFLYSSSTNSSVFSNLFLSSSSGFFISVIVLFGSRISCFAFHVFYY